ncbi:MAG: phosphotransferase [Candidatus Rokubacteria bacterium]|nr:phosphotransferase [Candidatus Rokubacteria bacterium]
MSPSSAAFPADPVLHQLPMALDPGHMRKVFSERLADVGQRRLQVEACRVERVRYRRGERCVLQYALSLRNAWTGLAQQRWVAAEMYPDERLQHRWRKLRAGNAQVTDARDSATGSLLTDLGMLVHFFPHDPRLPTLGPLTTAPPRQLEAALLRGFGPGSWRAESWTTETVRYRAALGATLRYAAEAREAGSGRARWKCFYVKVYPAGGAAAGHAALAALWGRAAVRDADLSVARPIEYFPELGAVAQEEVHGVTFEELLCHGRDPAGAARRIGRALARFHQRDAGPNGPAAPLRGRSDHVTTVHRAAQRLAWVDPGTQAELERLAGAIAAGLEDVPLRPTHGDLKIDHVLLDADSVSVVDLDSFALGDPMMDLGSLLADMALQRVRGRLAVDCVRPAAGALVEGYFRHAPAQWRTRLPVCCAGATLDKAVHSFQRQQGGWRTHIRALIHEAEGLLAGRCWW